MIKVIIGGTGMLGKSLKELDDFICFGSDKDIYDFKELTPTEKAYYYRDIKPLIDSLLNRTLQEYLEVVRSNRGRK